MLGKFASIDAVLSPDDPEQNNGYAYSANSPITRSDPSGNEPTDPTCTTAACRNAYYGAPPSGDGTDISNAPVAAGNGGSAAGSGSGKSGGSGSGGSVSLSAHVSINASDPRLPSMRKAAFEDYGVDHPTTTQEYAIWFQICVIARTDCGQFGSQLMGIENAGMEAELSNSYFQLEADGNDLRIDLNDLAYAQNDYKEKFSDGDCSKT